MSAAFPIHRLQDFGCLSQGEMEQVRALGGAPVELPRHSVIRSEGSADRSIYLLVDGWVLSSFLLRDGERQVVKLHLPGDMLGTTGLCVDTAIDSLLALTPVTVRKVSPRTLGGLMASSQPITAFFFLSAQKERIALIDRLASVARSSAVARIATFLLDLNDRLTAIGQAQDGKFDLRVTQEQLGDLVGLTSVHVNRMLRRLEEESLLERQGSSVRIPHIERLRDVASVPQRQMSQDLSWLVQGSPDRDEGAEAIAPADAPLRR